jgi:hypothetical protein
VKEWTDERRKRQAALIRHWMPWQQSTGPRTAAGKARASRNAFKNSPRQELREIARFVARIKRDQHELAARLCH